MKCGTIKCECGQQFYFESAKETAYKTVGFDTGHFPIQEKVLPTVRCPKCGKSYEIDKYPDKMEEILDEEIEEPVEE